MKKICVVIGSRANYSSIKSAMRAIADHPDLELQLVVGASALLDRYGAVVKLIERDGFKPAAQVHMLIEGETPATMAKSTGLGLMELPTVFETLAPDFVLTVGDRFETMATTLAAAYMNIAIAHTMGGEVSGHHRREHPPRRHQVRPSPFPGERRRARAHHPARREAGRRASRRLPAHRSRRRDPARARTTRATRRCSSSASATGSTSRSRFLLVSQHPVTTEYGAGERQIGETLSRGARDRPAGDRAVAQRRCRLRGHRPRHPQVARARARRTTCISSRTCRSRPMSG